jgi:hypothetical protein
MDDDSANKESSFSRKKEAKRLYFLLRLNALGSNRFCAAPGIATLSQPP